MLGIGCGVDTGIATWLQPFAAGTHTAAALLVLPAACVAIAAVLAAIVEVDAIAAASDGWRNTNTGVAAAFATRIEQRARITAALRIGVARTRREGRCSNAD